MHQRQLRRRILAGLAALGSAVAVSAAVAPAAQATATTGTIAGTITQASGGSDAYNVCAEVYSASDTTDPVGSACSDHAGDYSVSGLAPGQYLVQFVDGDTVRHDVVQWFPNEPDSGSAGFVRVDAGGTATANAVMAAGGWLTGTITDGSTGQPIENACLQVYDSNGSQTGGIADTADAAPDFGQVTYELCTDSNGQYASGGIAAGDVQLSVYGPGVDYYGSTNENASVTSGAATTFDAAMQAISGTVSDANGPAQYAQVSLADSSENVFADMSTGADGTYTLYVLPGTYTVEFTDTGNGGGTQWYDAKANAADATPVVVTDAPVGNVSATFGSVQTGTIAGTVTAGGVALPGMDVKVCDSANNCTYSSTDANGMYQLSEMAVGDYTVEFEGDQNGGYSDGNGNWQNTDTSAYLSQYYPDTVATNDVTPETVTVSAGATVTADDHAVLGTTYAGTITDAATGQPVANVCVFIQPDSGSYYPTSYVCTDSSGAYQTYGVPAGTYRLDFINDYGRYIEQYWNGKPDYDSADVLTVGATPTQNTAYNVQMQLGGNISGTVTDNHGAKLANICVDLFPVTGGTTGAGFEAGCTDETGKYSTSSVAAGQYKVEFVDDSGTYGNVYYDGAASLASATTVDVTQGATTSGIDAQLTGTAVPDAPTNVQASAGNGAATVTFDAPASDGGSAITGYVITSSPACASCTGLTSASTSTTVRGLTNGTSYTFTVAAVNSVGQGADSPASNAVTPSAPTGGGGGGGGVTAGVPGAPTNVAAAVNVSTVTVAFSPPASDGGAAISEYTINPSPACAACSGLSTSGTSSTVSGLTAGASYTFTVTAHNVAGAGPASVASNAVTPTGAAQSPVSSATYDPTSPATVTNNGTTATASGGTGTVTVSDYPSNPAATPTYDSTNAYMDVSVAHGSTFSSVVIKDCKLNGGASLQWWNPDAGSGGAWQAVVGDPTDTSGLPACLTVTIDAKSSPTIAQLTGTIFGAARRGVSASSVSVSDPGAQTGAAGYPVSLQLSASDTVKGQTPAFSATGLPTGLSISRTGLISGAPSRSGSYHVTVTAKDSAGASQSVSFPFTVRRRGGCPSSAPYTDVSVNSVYCGDVLWAKQWGLFSGAKFRPGAVVSRQLLAVELYRSRHQGADAGACPADYAGVAGKNVRCGDVRWAVRTGAMPLDSSGSFQAGHAVTRQVLAYALYVIANGKRPPVSGRSYAGLPAGSGLTTAVRWAVSHHVMALAHARFEAGAPVRRAQLAVWLFRAENPGRMSATVG